MWPQYEPVGAHASAALGAAVLNVSAPTGGVEVDGLLVQCETQNVRYTFDKSTPVASASGFVLTAGNDPVLIPVTSGVIKFLREASGAILHYQWVRVIPSGR